MWGEISGVSYVCVYVVKEFCMLLYYYAQSLWVKYNENIHMQHESMLVEMKYSHTHASPHTRTWTDIHRYTHIHTHTHAHTHIHTHTHTHTYKVLEKTDSGSV